MSGEINEGLDVDPQKNEFESNLPEAKYIKVWKKKEEESKTKIYLKVNLPHSRWESKKSVNLQRLILEYKIPIDSCNISWFDKFTFSGNSEETGEYTFSSYSSLGHKEIITLKATRKKVGSGNNRMSELIRIVKDYVSLSED